MIPLQVAPPIPDAGTLDRIIGPFGATIVLALLSALLASLCWWLLKGRLEDNRASATAINALHQDYSAKLLSAEREYRAKYEGVAEQLIRVNIESAAAARDLAAAVRTTAVRP